MRNIVVFALVTAATTGAAVTQAQEMGRVLSATPITQELAVPQQVCGNETVYGGPRPTTGAGAVLGAIAGGAAGNAIGGGGGRAAATALGVIGGAVLGNQIEAGPSGYRNVQRCTTETYYESRVIGYDVVYEYAGRRHRTRTQSDPGEWIALSVQPAVPLMPSDDAQTYGNRYGSGYAQPGVVLGTQPGPPAYIVQPPPTIIEFSAPYGYPHRPYHPHRPPRPHYPYGGY